MSTPLSLSSSSARLVCSDWMCVPIALVIALSAPWGLMLVNHRGRVWQGVDEHLNAVMGKRGRPTSFLGLCIRAQNRKISSRTPM